MVESGGDAVEQAPQCRFVQELNSKSLFSVGSIIISYDCMGLDDEKWELTVYRVLNIPGGSVSWVLGEKEMFIYKYKRRGCGGGVSRKSGRKDPIVLDYREVVGR